MCSARLVVAPGNQIIQKDSAPETQFSRLHFVYWNAAPAFLRQVFRGLWRLHANSPWEDNQSSGKELMLSLRFSEIVTSCNRFQTDLIQNGNSNQWDLLLLLDIIKNLNLLVQPPSIPIFSRLKLRDIDFLKHTRNKLAHAGQNSLEETTYQKLWDETKRILTSMGMTLKLLEGQLQSDITHTLSAGVNEYASEANQFILVGDELMKKSQFTEAVAEFSKGIRCENVPSPLLGLLFSNRSLAYLEMKNWQNAKDDAKSSITLQPESFLGYARLGKAYEGLENFHKATLNLSIAIRLGDKSKLTDESWHWCKVMAVRKSSKLHLDPDCIKYMIDIPDCDTKFPHGTKEDFISQGNKYLCGISGCPVDYRRAAEFYSLAADMDCAQGLFLLGKMTMEGQGVKRDVKKGFELFLKAAEQDAVEDLGNGVKQLNVAVSHARFAVGLSYEDGYAVEKDPYKALEWYLKAIYCGHAGAANNTGLMMKNHLNQREFLKLAAHLGSISAIENLAINYLETNCLKEAQMYFHLAVQRGSINFKGQEDKYVCDSSIDFDPMMVAELLEKEVRRSSIVGKTLDTIEKYKNTFEINECEDPPTKGNDITQESLGRNDAILTHRQSLRANHEQMKEQCGWRKATLDPIHSLFGAEKIQFEKLEDTSFKELDFLNGWAIYPGRFIELTVIDDAIVGSGSIHLLAEDRNGDVGLIAVCNYQQTGPSRKKVHEEIGFGSRLTIFYPVVQKNIGGLMEMRVDDPELIFKRKHLRTPDRCRYCGKNEEKPVLCKSCRRAKYCSIACLRNDAEILHHSLVCLKVIN